MHSRTNIQSGIFITGTDTGVGKTYIAAGIADALRKKNVNVGVMKPAETGCRSRSGKLLPSDALLLRKASGARDALDLINPYRFREPLAPAVAAAFAGDTIDLRRIKAAYRELSRRHEYLIVEGAGGIMVPLLGNYLYLDLARALKLPVVIIARPGLGTLNHSLLTVAALKAQNVKIAGIVLNHASSHAPGRAERTNKAALEQLSDVPILLTALHGTTAFSELADYLYDAQRD